MANTKPYFFLTTRFFFLYIYFIFHKLQIFTSLTICCQDFLCNGFFKHDKIAFSKEKIKFPFEEKNIKIKGRIKKFVLCEWKNCKKQLLLDKNFEVKGRIFFLPCKKTNFLLQKQHFCINFLYFYFLHLFSPLCYFTFFLFRPYSLDNKVCFFLIASRLRAAPSEESIIP